tara:strand:+ start:299 stop:826 length:528 start_codon:yes stop_codon:yes gene_type:complete
MTYFYALLGVGMFASIFGLLQISTTIINQQRNFNPSSFNYEFNHKLMDKEMLSLLNSSEFQQINSLGIGSQLCIDIKNNSIITDPPNVPILYNQYHNYLNNYDIDSNFLTDSNGILNSKLFYKFLDACALNRQGLIKHRIIIDPPDNNVNEYKMFSCILDPEVNSNNRCPFEEIN